MMGVRAVVRGRQCGADSAGDAIVGHVDMSDDNIT